MCHSDIAVSDQLSNGVLVCIICVLQRMVKQRNLPFSFKPEQGSRVGLLPRGAKDDSGMLWFDLPAHMVFHVANAWEEEDGTVKVRKVSLDPATFCSSRIRCSSIARCYGRDACPCAVIK
jgi:carotenoid cleavage dioxygenase-like enzyme